MTQDKYEGQGGSYVVDAKGKRQLVERTDSGLAPAPDEAVTADPVEPVADAANSGGQDY